MKKIPSAALVALKNALPIIYWEKRDLRLFLEDAMKNNVIVGTLGWNSTAKSKKNLTGELVDRMIARKDLYQEDILSLIIEVANMTDFSHFKKWPDWQEKEKKAKIAVTALRKHTDGFIEQMKENDRIQERKQKQKMALEAKQHFEQKLEKLKNDFYTILGIENAQAKGYELEKWLHELFLLFDLDPKPSYKTEYEQIDGAFTHDGTDYLMEAKWKKDLTPLDDLRGFGAKVKSKLKNALGVFISINGFVDACKSCKDEIVMQILLIDGRNLMEVLEGRIRLDDMIREKRRKAAFTGDKY